MIATDRTPGGTPGLRTLEETADSSVYSIEKHRYQDWFRKDSAEDRSP